MFITFCLFSGHRTTLWAICQNDLHGIKWCMVRVRKPGVQVPFLKVRLLLNYFQELEFHCCDFTFSPMIYEVLFHDFSTVCNHALKCGDVFCKMWSTKHYIDALRKQLLSTWRNHGLGIKIFQFYIWWNGILMKFHDLWYTSINSKSFHFCWCLLYPLHSPICYFQ